VSAAPQGPPPPPSSGGAAAGSPFGRFPTQLLGLVAVLAAGVAAVSFSMSGDGGNSAGPELSRIAGTWSSPGIGAEAAPQVSFDDTGQAGTLMGGGCTGDLRLRERTSDTWVFAYTDESGERGCPRRLTVTVSLTGRDRLKIDAHRPGGRLYASETMRRRR
jgi:hypothetical protein